MRLARLVCGLCACIVLAAVPVAIFDIIAFSINDRFAGCQVNPEIVVNVTCWGSQFKSLLEIVLNLPLLFIYVPPVTIFGPPWPNPAAMRLLYAGDVVLVLGLAYRVLVLIQRCKAR